MTETKKKTPSGRKPQQIVKHDQSKHEGAKGGSRPDLEPKPVDKALEEVRKVRRENEERLATHDRVVVERVVEGVKGEFNVTTANGLVYIDAKNVVLDHDGIINARHALDAAFQAVS